MQIKDSKLRERTGVTILAIRKEGDASFNANPPRRRRSARTTW